MCIGWVRTSAKCVVAPQTLHDAHQHFVNCLDFNAKDPHLVTGGVDDTVRVWCCK